MTIWTPIAAFPNISLGSSINSDIIALAYPGDDRLTKLRNLYQNFNLFLGKFTNNFGEKIQPSVMIVRSDAPASVYTAEAIASFRDLISVSTIPYNRAIDLKHPRSGRIVFSNSFWMYPWMIDKNYEHVIINTPSILGFHNATKLRAQSSPEMPVMNLDARDIDKALFNSLQEYWGRRYTQKKPSWQQVALFRSLNMAHQASLMPAAGDTTFYDVGRCIALWVSAFEILVHPGGDGRADLRKVFDLIESTPWRYRLSRLQRYQSGSGRMLARRTLSSQIYFKLYTARNNFIHGNPVSPRSLLIKRSGRHLLQYAAPLYRLALTSFLDISFKDNIPSADNPEAFGEFICNRRSFSHYQEVIEEGIHTAIAKKTQSRK